MRSAALVVCAALLAIPSTVLGQADPDAQVAVKEGGGIAALYSDDATLLPPGGIELQGRAAIEAYWQEAMGAMPGVTVKLETKELHNLGDVAVEVGSYANTGADGEHVGHGKYLVVWMLNDGTWQMARDIWNSSMEQ
jgi:ketosteroid isomerase-like protein